MDVMNVLPTFLLVFVRTLAFFTVLPIFSYRTIPNQFKIGLAFFLALIMVFTLEVPPLEIDANYFLLTIKEVLVGLFVGLIAAMLMFSIQVAGGFIDMKIGFMIANVIDPQTGAQSPLIGGFLYSFAILLMLALNGHHLLIDGVYYSYQFLPMEQLFLDFGNENVIEYIATLFNAMFVIAFQMAIPVVGSLFLLNVALGTISRAVPQMNIFVVGFPIQIFVGLVILLISMPGFFMIFRSLMEKMMLAMRSLLQLLGGI